MSHPIVEFARELGVDLYDGQRQALEEYFASGRQNWLLLAGRRSGKSLVSDVCALYDACVVDYSRFLLPGEPRHVLVVSVRLDNSVQHVRQSARLLRHSKELRKLIKEEKQDRLVLRNGVTILSLPASARSVRGLGCSLAVLDEAAHFLDVSESNQSAEEILAALEPTQATFGDAARLIITTSPAQPSGLVYDLCERKLENWHITRRTSQELNPRIAQSVIDNAMARDEESARSEYFCEWRASVEAFLHADKVEACVNMARSQVERGQPGVSYTMSVDPAVMRDSYAYLVAHAVEGKVVVDYSRSLPAPVDLIQAEELLFSLNQRFKPAQILTDTASTSERLRSQLPNMVYRPFSKQTKLRCYSSLKECVNLARLSIPGDCPGLVAELKALRLRGGSDIAAPTTGRVRHDDQADCLALVADALVGSAAVGARVIFDPFSCWDSETHEVDFDFGPVPIGSVHDAHSPGASSWRNCRHRTKGCRQCYQELQAAGWFDDEYVEAIRRGDAVAMSEEDGDRLLRDQLGMGEDRIREMARSEADEQRFAAKLRERARNRANMARAT